MSLLLEFNARLFKSDNSKHLLLRQALTSSIILDMKQIKVYSYCITHNIEFLQRTLMPAVLIEEPADPC